MRKYLVLICCLFFITAKSDAQYVNIPDSNFRSFLIGKYPSCFDTLRRMDTTCASIINQISMEIHYIGWPYTPDSLRIIDITGIQYFKNLKYLDCTANAISIIPLLPKYLETFFCFGNNIFNLPELPNTIKHLQIHLNNITCLPYLPNGIDSMWADFDSKILCIPNLPTSAYAFFTPQGYISTPPLCNPTNNINHCQSFPIIQLFAYTDINNNNILDTNEFPKYNLKFTLSNNNYSYTNTQGIAYANADSLGTYTITATAPNFYNAVPASYTHNFTSYDTLVIDTFALQPTVLKDSVFITAIPYNGYAIPSFTYPYLVSYENVGTTVLSTPIIHFNYDSSLLVYDSSSANSVVNNGNSLSLNIGNIVPGQTGSFIVYFTVKPTAVLGSTVASIASINANSVSGVDSVTTIVSGSYDPNDKQATPSLTTQQVADGNYINYIIRFQNTGTDTAFNVVIADTLDSKLMATELQMVGSSHNCKTTVKDNIIFFEFLNIYLPDSNVNKTGSNGFVSFKLKPISSVSAGTTIPNRAAIYFDYNSPVITKTANTMIQNPLPLQLLNYEASPTPPKEGLKNWTVLNKWTTANELNTSHFIVQRSDDGRIYKSVGSIAAKGFGEYIFIDNSLPSGFETVYYQLQVVDKDGKFTYSKVIKISSSVEALDGLILVENPAKHQLKLNVIAASLNNTIANVLNAQGMIMKTFTLKQGYQTIDITGFATGVYYLQTKIGSHKLVIE